MVLMVRATPINAGLVSNTPPLARNRQCAHPTDRCRQWTFRNAILREFSSEGDRRQPGIAGRIERSWNASNRME